MSDDGFDMTDELLDVRQIDEDERLLRALGSGGLPDDAAVDDRALAEMLGAWRAELDEAAVSLPAFDTSALRPIAALQQRPGRGRRAAVAAAAGVVTVLGMTGTAAAISGPRGPLAPLSRVLFGAAPVHDPVDSLALRARSLLNKAAASISAAASAGHISSSERFANSRAIDAAVRLLTQESNPPKSLVQQAESLCLALAGIPDEPKPASSPLAAVTPSSGPSSTSSQQPVAPPVVQLPTTPSAAGETDGPQQGGPTAEPTEPTQPETDVSEPARPSTSPSPSASRESSHDSGSGTGSAENELDP